jgi:hypothetical protein
MKPIACLLLLCLVTSPALARRKHRHEGRDDEPVTRAEVAKAIEPAIDAHRTKDGRIIAARDVANLEDVSIRISDETVEEAARIERLTLEVAALKEEVRQLQRRRHRLIVP